MPLAHRAGLSTAPDICRNQLLYLFKLRPAHIALVRLWEESEPLLPGLASPTPTRLFPCIIPRHCRLPIGIDSSIRRMGEDTIDGAVPWQLPEQFSIHGAHGQQDVLLDE